VLEERLTGRRQCCFCGRIYNVHVHASAREGFCDEDGMPLLRRADDDESVIRERLKYYERDSLPVLEYYRDSDLHRIDGNSTPGLVLEALEEALDHVGAVSRSVVA